ncbi:MAG: enoyl-CoA hydratase/isomerase family protein [Actinomycetota bacterium]
MNARLYPVAFATVARVARLASQLPPLDALFLESVTYSLLQSGDEHTRWLNDNREKVWRAGRESSVVVFRRDDDTLHVSLADPERHNAFSRVMRDELREALTLAVLDETITRVVLDGQGSNFSSGGDLAEFGTSNSPLVSHLVRTTDSVAQLLLTIGDRIGGALECRVHGHNVGAGAELAAFAPRVVVARGTTFRLPEVSMGLVPGAGGTVSVTRRIGRHRAALMMLSGCTVDAETALDWGLVDEIGDRT